VMADKEMAPATSPPQIATPRLLLRGWRNSDLPAFAAMNTDPEVMAFFPGTYGRAESDKRVVRIREHFRRHGFGFWAVEAPGTAPFIGFTGLWTTDFETPFTPCIEIGWRLAARFWGRGYATEAARASLRFGFATLRLGEIVSFTAEGNLRSRRVMERIGMTRDAAGDFDHPGLPADSPLRRHVLYRLSRAAWTNETA